jgi:hypothetical protein
MRCRQCSEVRGYRRGTRSVSFSLRPSSLEQGRPPRERPSLLGDNGSHNMDDRTLKKMALDELWTLRERLFDAGKSIQDFQISQTTPPSS